MSIKLSVLIFYFLALFFGQLDEEFTLYSPIVSSYKVQTSGSSKKTISNIIRDVAQHCLFQDLIGGKRETVGSSYRLSLKYFNCRNIFFSNEDVNNYHALIIKIFNEFNSFSPHQLNEVYLI